MSLYECVVYDEYKNRKLLTLELNSMEEVDTYADKNNLNIVKVSLKKEKLIKLKNKELKLICKKISILLESGCEITQILNILKSQSNKNLKNIFSNISNNLNKGNTISDSFQKTNSFSHFFISMIEAGEVSGNLDRVMNDLYIYYDKEDKLKSKIITMLIYPLLLIIISLLSTIFMVFFIMPNFQKIFENNIVNPPLITISIIKMTEFIRENYLILNVLFLILILLSLKIITNNKKIKLIISELKFKIPIVKNINTLIVTTRFSRVFKILIQSRIQIIDAINISAKIIDNNYILNKLSISNQYIRQGNKLSYSLEKSNVFPSLFVSMIKVGEESGKLDDTLNTITLFYENDLDNKINQIMKFVEPSITIILGLFIGGFTLAMVLPMFDSIVTI